MTLVIAKSRLLKDNQINTDGRGPSVSVGLHLVM